jgi:glutathione S-transferase
MAYGPVRIPSTQQQPENFLDDDGNRFTAGDLIMTTVLRSLDHTDLVAPDKRLAAYVERCASRPAFKRALDAHLQDFQSPT